MSTTLAAQDNRHTNNKVQHGELVTATTTVTIPPMTQVPAPSTPQVPTLSLLTELSGAEVDVTNASVEIQCQAGPTCVGSPTLIKEAAKTKLGVVVLQNSYTNNTSSPVTLTITTKNILVKDGQGPLTANANAYRGASAPSNLNDFNESDKVPNGTSGSVEIMAPSVTVEAVLLSGHTDQTEGMPVAGSLEPGTEDLFVKLTISNPTVGSALRNVNVDVKTPLESIGLIPRTSFNDAKWHNGVVKVQNLESDNAAKVTLYVPVDWKKDMFQGSTATEPKSATIRATGETGPVNGGVAAVPHETQGKNISGEGSLTFTPLYPVPAVISAVTKVDGQPLSDATPPKLARGNEAVVTFTPSLTGGHGFNPILCVKAENSSGSVSKPTVLSSLILHEPQDGVSTIQTGHNCGAGEIAVQLPEPANGHSLPPVKFKVSTSNTPLTELVSAQITATLKVDSLIEKGQGTPGARSYTASTVQSVDVIPFVDLKAGVTWFKPSGESFGETEQVVYNDYDTETNPVKAKVSIQNIGSDAATPQGSTVTVKIPTGFTIEGSPDKDGWTCATTTQTGHDLLTCSRATNLEGNQQTPFEVTIQSPSGPGKRLTADPLTITGFNPDNRATVSPFDQESGNDTVNTTAKVNIPKPDFAPKIEITDTLRRQGRDVKPYAVEVTHKGDAVPANELKVRLSSEISNPTLTVTNQNGWICGLQNIFVDCVWPNPIEANHGKLPPISATAHVEGALDAVKLKATTSWERPGLAGQPAVVTADSEPTNDTDTVGFTPFTQWVDADVKVSFENPTPNASEDPKPKVTVSHADGGKEIPVGTKVQVTVPPNAQVQGGEKVHNCQQMPNGGAPGSPSAPVTHECELKEALMSSHKVEGPTITGVAGPNQTISAKVILNEDVNQSNNQHSAKTSERPAPPAPAPAPAPSVSPSPSDVPSPKPEDRPKNLPPAPKPPATPAPATPGYTPVEETPQERATQWVNATVPENAKTKMVLIGRDNVFADSLASGGLQGLMDAPLLLNPVDQLSAKTKEALDRLKPEQVILLGGPAAQSPAVEAELRRLGWSVSRVHGATRVETAIDVAKAYAPDATHGILARAYAHPQGSGSQAFADTLSGGALAARQERPVFLTQSGELTDSLRDYLAKAKIKHLTLLGAAEAISPQVEAELNKMGIETKRISGQNRAETSVNVAQAMGYWHAGEAESVLVVNGESEDAWTDAFPAALYAKRFEVPVVLTSTDKLLPNSSTWLAPGVHRKPPTRVICGYSVGDVKQCSYSPAKAS